MRFPTSQLQVTGAERFVAYWRGTAGAIDTLKPKVDLFFRADTDRATIGRDDACDFRLAGASISAEHARLLRNRDSGQVLVLDLKSTNGTFFNGKRLTEPTVFGPQDTVDIGEWCIVHAPSVTFRKFVPRDAQEKSLFEALVRNPNDEETREIYADWLEEHGHIEEAEILVLERKLRSEPAFLLGQHPSSPPQAKIALIQNMLRARMVRFADRWCRVVVRRETLPVESPAVPNIMDALTLFKAMEENGAAPLRSMATLLRLLGLEVDAREVGVIGGELTLDVGDQSPYVDRIDISYSLFLPDRRRPELQGVWQRVWLRRFEIDFKRDAFDINEWFIGHQSPDNARQARIAARVPPYRGVMPEAHLVYDSFILSPSPQSADACTLAWYDALPAWAQ